MPRAKGLFRRAIVQSAAPTGMLERDDATRRAVALLGQLELTDASRLCDVPVDALLDAQAACAASRVWKTGMFFSPVVDGDTLPTAPAHAIRRGAGSGVDLLIGTTSDEMRLFLWGVDPASVSESAIAPMLSFELPGARPDGEPFADWARARYEQLRRDRGASIDAASLLAAVQTDTRLRLPSLRVAEVHAAQHPGTWVYEFTQTSRIAALGACHALDLPFTFGTLDAPGMREFAGDGPDERAVSDAMISAWASFARKGDPSCDAFGHWPRYAPPDRLTMRIGPGQGVVADPFAPERAILDEIDFPELPPAR
jgi:para-nitrobenzyl esterase